MPVSGSPVPRVPPCVDKLPPAALPSRPRLIYSCCSNTYCLAAAYGLRRAGGGEGIEDEAPSADYLSQNCPYLDTINR